MGLGVCVGMTVSPQPVALTASRHTRQAAWGPRWKGDFWLASLRKGQGKEQGAFWVPRLMSTVEARRRATPGVAAGTVPADFVWGSV